MTLNAIEEAALLPLRLAWAELPRSEIAEDRWWAAVGVLRADGASVVAPLTVERLDPYLVTFERTGKTTPFSMPPAAVKP